MLIFFMVRKNEPILPLLVGLTAGWQAVRWNVGGIEKILKISTGKTNGDIYFVNICAMLL